MAKYKRKSNQRASEHQSRKYALKNSSICRTQQTKLSICSTVVSLFINTTINGMLEKASKEMRLQAVDSSARTWGSWLLKAHCHLHKRGTATKCDQHPVKQAIKVIRILIDWLMHWLAYYVCCGCCKCCTICTKLFQSCMGSEPTPKSMGRPKVLLACMLLLYQIEHIHDLSAIKLWHLLQYLIRSQDHVMMFNAVYS